jgi:hypothetical protein
MSQSGGDGRSSRRCGLGELGLASLLERERELALLERCLADAGAGRGQLVVVEGPGVRRVVDRPRPSRCRHSRTRSGAYGSRRKTRHFRRCTGCTG